MQIITGKFAKRKLIAPKGDQTRPTLGRVKEALFSIIADRIAGATVLDLFAGSGAYAAECYSRGAKQVVLVDQSAEAKKAIATNLRQMEYTLIDLPAEHALNRLKNQHATFDIIFMDPPYDDAELATTTLRLISRFNLLNQNGIVVFETRDKNNLPKIPKSYIINDERTYGIAKILFLEQNNE